MVFYYSLGLLVARSVGWLVGWWCFVVGISGYPWTYAKKCLMYKYLAAAAIVVAVSCSLPIVQDIWANNIHTQPSQSEQKIMVPSALVPYTFLFCFCFNIFKDCHFYL